MLPLWADIFILAALPVILGTALWLWGEGDHPDNGVVHEQGGSDRGGGDDSDALAAA